jgi:hypothetical protein
MKFNLKTRWLCLLLLARLADVGFSAAPVLVEPIPTRGYYMTFMRMPTFGLPQWKQMIDCIHDDGGNTLLLWTGGGFRSKKFPITWKYNATHKNIENDFTRELIDYAHGRGIRVLLCLSPFCYDGVNQYPIEHPELKARQKNGEPANFWGMHSWGYNLCPSRKESQRFMLEYAREICFEFYPNADGLLIESSDYAICYCPDCREHYFEREFEFVKQISDEIWKAKSNATVIVYPHYFTTRKVPGFDVAGSKQTFDPRWTLFFTPHSAHIETNLIARAKGAIYSDEGLSLGTPGKIQSSFQLAQKYHLTGYLPSLEPMTCPPGPPNDPGPLLKPFHFDWLNEGEMPLDTLLMRVMRIAYREYTRNPELSRAQFEQKLGTEIFGASATPQAIKDLLELQEVWFFEAGWMAPGPFVAPQKFKERTKDWPPERLEPYRKRAANLELLSARYAKADTVAEREMRRIAAGLVTRWKAAGF